MCPLYGGSTVYIDDIPKLSLIIIIIELSIIVTMSNYCRVLADKHIPQTCIKFAQEKLNELREKNIIYNLMSHMIYMCDIGLVTASIILKVFKIVTSHTSETT